jgi:hypothetical protein
MVLENENFIQFLTMQYSNEFLFTSAIMRNNTLKKRFYIELGRIIDENSKSVSKL